MVICTEAQLFADDYSIYDLDLGIERSNSMLDMNVIAFTILSVTPGAKASIRIFDVAKQKLNIPDDISEGDTFTRLCCATIYISNQKQPGYKIRILVLKSSSCVNIGGD